MVGIFGNLAHVTENFDTVVILQEVCNIYV